MKRTPLKPSRLPKDEKCGAEREVAEFKNIQRCIHSKYCCFKPTKGCQENE